MISMVMRSMLTGQNSTKAAAIAWDRSDLHCHCQLGSGAMTVECWLRCRAHVAFSLTSTLNDRRLHRRARKSHRPRSLLQMQCNTSLMRQYRCMELQASAKTRSLHGCGLLFARCALQMDLMLCTWLQLPSLSLQAALRARACSRAWPAVS